MRTRIAIVLLILLMIPLESMAQKGGRASSSRSSSRSTSSKSRAGSKRSAKSSPRKSSPNKSTISPRRSTIAQRDGNGRIKRSTVAKREFMKQTGYANGRKGYVVDHIVPLECGGADVPSNMQWQTIAEAKIKDRTERNCRRE